MPDPMLSEDVPADLVTTACEAAYGTPLDPGDDRRQIARAIAAVHGTIVEKARAEWFKELFGDPTERLKEPMKRDHPEEVMARLGVACVAPGDLADVLSYVTGFEKVAVVPQATLDRLFAALKHTVDAGGEAK